MVSEPLTKGEITRDLDFEVGQQYVRKDLHEVCGGNNQPGISPIDDLGAIFLFGSTTDDEYGYEDKWLPDDHFLLTGVGQEGDQKWEGSNNKSLGTHKADNRRVFLFERVPGKKPTVATYVGEFEYVNVEKTRLPDINDEWRWAYQFEIQPVNGGTVELPDDIDNLDLATLYEQAKMAANSSSSATPSGSTQTNSGSKSTRSEIVKEFALRAADGVCQGCNTQAPFYDKNDDLYLEVHHLTFISDDGPDHPDNVIAVCPNCHAEVHNGIEGDQLNDQLRKKAQNRSIPPVNP